MQLAFQKSSMCILIQYRVMIKRIQNLACISSIKYNYIYYYSIVAQVILDFYKLKNMDLWKTFYLFFGSSVSRCASFSSAVLRSSQEHQARNAIFGAVVVVLLLFMYQQLVRVNLTSNGSQLLK